MNLLRVGWEARGVGRCVCCSGLLQPLHLCCFHFCWPTSPPLPTRTPSAAKAKETLPAGWEQDISRVRAWGDLPANAQAYVRRIEELSGVLTLSPHEGDGTPEIAWGDLFFYYAPNGVLPPGQPFARKRRAASRQV